MKKISLAARFLSIVYIPAPAGVRADLHSFARNVAHEASVSTWQARVRWFLEYRRWLFARGVVTNSMSPVDLRRVMLAPWVPRAFANYVADAYAGKASVLDRACASLNTAYKWVGLPAVFNAPDIIALRKSQNARRSTPVKQSLGIEAWMLKKIIITWVVPILEGRAPMHAARVMFVLYMLWGFAVFGRFADLDAFFWEGVLLPPTGSEIAIRVSGRKQHRDQRGDTLFAPFTSSRCTLHRILSAWLHLCGGAFTAAGRVSRASGPLFRNPMRVGNRTRLTHIDYCVDVSSPVVSPTARLSRSKMVTFMRSALVQVVGMTPQEACFFTGHALRVGGMNAARRARMGEHLILATGDWASLSSARRYVRLNTTEASEPARAFMP